MLHIVTEIGLFVPKERVLLMKNAHKALQFFTGANWESGGTLITASIEEWLGTL
jgi:hypothetical protein